MKESMPRNKLARTLSTSGMAAKIGGNQLGLMIKRPFLSGENERKAKEKTDQKNAAILFNGLSLLRGTALKAAQFLSMENDILPLHFRKELEKSYHQVPPMNRALVRKILQSGFSVPYDRLFSRFELKAFAAASLGQVHRAEDKEGRWLAVKIQYPDISGTIANDIRLLKAAVRPMAEYRLIHILLDEVQTVLMAETDYQMEAEHIRFFSSRLNMSQVYIPKVYPELSCAHILSMSMIEGTLLDSWLASGPDQDMKDHVAQILHHIFLKGFYELNKIHADPNPGNFIVTDDLGIGLVDFGCVKSFDPSFIDLYRQLIRVGRSNDRSCYESILEQMQILSPEIDPESRDQLISVFMEMGEWISRLFDCPIFDFGKNKDYLEKGKQIARKMHRFRQNFSSCNPDFVFLDRTRYGLLRIFEKMNARISIHNPYEC